MAAVEKKKTKEKKNVAYLYLFGFFKIMLFKFVLNIFLFVQNVIRSERFST